jgi:hypothetical protein
MDKFYREYRKLGGTGSSAELCTMLEQFFEYVMPAYMGDCDYNVAGPQGESIEIKDQRDSMQKFSQHFCAGDDEEAYRVFRTVDNIVDCT